VKGEDCDRERGQEDPSLPLRVGGTNGRAKT